MQTSSRYALLCRRHSRRCHLTERSWCRPVVVHECRIIEEQRFRCEPRVGREQRCRAHPGGAVGRACAVTIEPDLQGDRRKEAGLTQKLPVSVLGQGRQTH